MEYTEMLIIILLLVIIYVKFNYRNNFTETSDNDLNSILESDIKDLEEYIDSVDFKNLDKVIESLSTDIQNTSSTKNTNDLSEFNIIVGYSSEELFKNNGGERLLNNNGKVIIKNLLNFKSHNINIFPQGTIIYIRNMSDLNITGWALSDGSTVKYILTDKNVYFTTDGTQPSKPEEETLISSGEYKTKNLVNKFIYGYSYENEKKYPIYLNGGESNVVLKGNQLGNHSHPILLTESPNDKLGSYGLAQRYFIYNVNNKCGSSCHEKQTINTNDTYYENNNKITKAEGHNNIPPYVKLVPLVKFL